MLILWESVDVFDSSLGKPEPVTVADVVGTWKSGVGCYVAPVIHMRTPMILCRAQDFDNVLDCAEIYVPSRNRWYYCPFPISIRIRNINIELINVLRSPVVPTRRRSCVSNGVRNSQPGNMGLA